MSAYILDNNLKTQPYFNHLSLNLIRQGNISSVDNIITELSVNDKRYRLLKEIEPLFVSSLLNDDINIDYATSIEKTFIEHLTVNPHVSLKWLNEIYVKYFSNQKILTNLLKLIGNLRHKESNSFAIIQATASLCHKNVEVRELGLRIFENIANLESLSVLQNLQLTPVWLDEYRKDIVTNIKEELCL